jgi:hypothetical protein
LRHRSFERSQFTGRCRSLPAHGKPSAQDYGSRGGPLDHRSPSAQRASHPRRSPFVQGRHAGTPGFHLFGTGGALRKVRLQFAFLLRRDLFVEEGHPFRGARMIHSARSSGVCVFGLHGVSSFTCFKIRLNCSSASAMRDLTVPSGMASTSPISRNFRPS